VSVLSADLIRARPYAGFSDPGLPIGYWRANHFVLGDASGGQRTIQLNFSLQGQGGPALFFSLEQLFVADADNNAKTGSLVTANMDPFNEGNPMTQPQTLTLAVGQSGGASLTQSQALHLPRYLGNAVQGATGALLVVFGNSDGDIIRVFAQGYYWSARSLNVDGGLRRPLSGLYSA